MIAIFMASCCVQFGVVAYDAPESCGVSLKTLNLWANRTIGAVPFTIRAGAFTPGEPVRWSAHRAFYYGSIPTFDVLRDGENVVLMTSETSTSSHSHLTFVLNFFDELKRRLP